MTRISVSAAMAAGTLFFTTLGSTALAQWGGNCTPQYMATYCPQHGYHYCYGYPTQGMPYQEVRRQEPRRSRSTAKAKRNNGLTVRNLTSAESSADKKKNSQSSSSSDGETHYTSRYTDGEISAANAALEAEAAAAAAQAIDQERLENQSNKESAPVTTPPRRLPEPREY